MIWGEPGESFSLLSLWSASIIITSCNPTLLSEIIKRTRFMECFAPFPSHLMMNDTRPQCFGYWVAHLVSVTLILLHLIKNFENDKLVLSNYKYDTIWLLNRSVLSRLKGNTSDDILRQPCIHCVQCCLVCLIWSQHAGHCLSIDKISLFAKLSAGKDSNKAVMYHLARRQGVTEVSHLIYLCHHHTSHVYVTMPTMLSSAHTGGKVQSLSKQLL